MKAFETDPKILVAAVTEAGPIIKAVYHDRDAMIALLKMMPTEVRAICLYLLPLYYRSPNDEIEEVYHLERKALQLAGLKVDKGDLLRIVEAFRRPADLRPLVTANEVGLTDRSWYSDVGWSMKRERDAKSNNRK